MRRLDDPTAACAVPRKQLCVARAQAGANAMAVTNGEAGSRAAAGIVLFMPDSATSPSIFSLFLI
jgi:hypothetical protein